MPIEESSPANENRNIQPKKPAVPWTLDQYKLIRDSLKDKFVTAEANRDGIRLGDREYSNLKRCFAGAVSTTYFATDDLGNEVVIKMPKFEISLYERHLSELTESFLMETTMLEKLDRLIYKDAYTLLFVQKQLPGESINDLIKTSSPSDYAWLRDTHLAAVKAFHEATGHRHGDPHPGNALVTFNGNKKPQAEMIDFGAAKIGELDSELMTAEDVFDLSWWLSGPQYPENTALTIGEQTFYTRGTRKWDHTDRLGTQMAVDSQGNPVKITRGSFWKYAYKSVDVTVAPNIKKNVPFSTMQSYAIVLKKLGLLRALEYHRGDTERTSPKTIVSVEPVKFKTMNKLLKETKDIALVMKLFNEFMDNLSENDIYLNWTSFKSVGIDENGRPTSSDYYLTTPLDGTKLTQEQIQYALAFRKNAVMEKVTECLQEYKSIGRLGYSCTEWGV